MEKPDFLFLLRDNKGLCLIEKLLTTSSQTVQPNWKLILYILTQKDGTNTNVDILQHYGVGILIILVQSETTKVFISTSTSQ